MQYKPKKCIECGKEFIPKSGTNVYCPGPLLYDRIYSNY